SPGHPRDLHSFPTRRSSDLAHALRSSARKRELELALERERAVLAVVGQATSELSLAHTLETAVRRVAELLDVERVAVYLRTEERSEEHTSELQSRGHLVCRL